MEVNNNAKRLAKNTIYMYIRMFFLMLLSLYMSRILLHSLGVKDFGVYNLVGSFVAMFSGIKTLFATSTQRFLNYEMGRGNIDLLNVIFNTSVYVNAIISFLFFAVLEIAGLWYFNGRINVDPDKITDAYVVFHLSILTTIVSIMTIPYDAVILAREKMNFFAVISVVEGIFKLIAAMALTLSPDGRLVLYAVFLLIVSILIRIIEYVYCSQNFPECKIRLVGNKSIFKQMFTFSGWQLMGNTAFAISQHGVNVVFNFFGGTIVNAARGLSLQILDVTNRFLGSITIVSNPYCVKKYAEGDSEQMFRAMFFLSKILFLIQLILALPIALFIEEILSLWLMEVPPYTSGFVRLILLYSVFRSLHGPIDIVFKAVGEIKIYQIIESVLLIMPIVLGFLYLNFNVNYYVVFVLIILFEILNLVAILLLSSKICKLDIKEYLKNVVVPCLVCLFIGVSTCGISFFYYRLLVRGISVILSFVLMYRYMCISGFSHTDLKIIENMYRI